MTKRHHKSADGSYHIDGHKFPVLIGSRAQVWHSTAFKTTGGLRKRHLKKNKHGNIVSKTKSAKGAQLLKRLTSKGYHTKKGHFGFVKRKPKAGSFHLGSRSKTRRGDKDFTTKRGNKDFHRRRHNVTRKRKPFTKKHKKRACRTSKGRFKKC
jgi:hypothetical protein